ALKKTFVNIEAFWVRGDKLGRPITPLLKGLKFAISMIFYKQVINQLKKPAGWMLSLLFLLIVVGGWQYANLQQYSVYSESCYGKSIEDCRDTCVSEKFGCKWIGGRQEGSCKKTINQECGVNNQGVVRNDYKCNEISGDMCSGREGGWRHPESGCVCNVLYNQADKWYEDDKNRFSGEKGKGNPKCAYRCPGVGSGPVPTPTPVATPTPGPTPTPTPTPTPEPDTASWVIRKFRDNDSDGVWDSNETATGIVFRFDWRENDGSWHRLETSGTTGWSQTMETSVGTKIEVKELGESGWTNTTGTTQIRILGGAGTYYFDFGNIPTSGYEETDPPSTTPETGI
ncbi:hypothetical protein ACFL18_02740, partial [Patescibacteria group bacterium]